MAEIKNLTEQNVTDLMKFFNGNIKPDNPEASILFKCVSKESYNKKCNHEECKRAFKELNDKIDSLNNKIDRIFGNFFLMNGKFIEPKISTVIPKSSKLYD